jgi:hypothetical protein
MTEMLTKDFAAWFMGDIDDAGQPIPHLDSDGRQKPGYGGVKEQLDIIEDAVRKYQSRETEGPDIGTMRSSLRTLSGYLAYMPKVLAESRAYASKKEAQYIELYYDPTVKNVSPTMIKKQAEAFAKNEILVVNWIEQLNKNILQICRSIQTDISYEKSVHPHSDNY